MTECAMPGEIRDRIAIVDHDVEVGHRTEQRPGQQCRATLPLWRTNGTNTGAERRLR